MIYMSRTHTGSMAGPGLGGSDTVSEPLISPQRPAPGTEEDRCGIREEEAASSPEQVLNPLLP